nr:glucose-6-phosphate 1-dehydrogenase, cytoplasmic isoform 2 [Quercus suber]
MQRPCLLTNCFHKLLRAEPEEEERVVVFGGGMAEMVGNGGRVLYGPTSSKTIYKGYLDKVGCALFKFALGCSFGRRGNTKCTDLSSSRERWKGAKITIEHPMHILCAYRVSLASLQPNQAVHTTIADAPPFHGEISYNDKYMVWFCPRTLCHITKETSYWDTLVESQLRSTAMCKPGFEIYTDYINALQFIENLDRLTLGNAHATGNTSEPAVGRGQQIGGRQGHGSRQSSQRHTSSWRPTSGQRPISSWRYTPVHDHTMEEVSQTADEMCLDTAYDMGSMAHDDVGPSYTFAYRDTSRSPSTSSTTSLLPTTHMTPPLTTRTAPTDIKYVSGSYDFEEGFQLLDKEISKHELLKNSVEGTSRRLFYLALPPLVYPSVCKMIRNFSMNKSDLGGWTRIVLVLRFANCFFLPLWNRDNIDNVQIVLREDFGTDGHGGYFDEYGVIRDIIQNHLLQVFAWLLWKSLFLSNLSTSGMRNWRFFNQFFQLKMKRLFLGNMKAMGMIQQFLISQSLQLLQL